MFIPTDLTQHVISVDSAFSLPNGDTQSPDPTDQRTEEENMSEQKQEVKEFEHDIERVVSPEMFELEAEQRELEEDAHGRAKKRVMDQQLKLMKRKREGDGLPADRMINYAIMGVIETMQEWAESSRQKAEAGRPSNQQNQYPKFRDLEDAGQLDEFVAASLGTCFNGCTRGRAVTAIAMEIAKRAENLLALKQILDRDKKDYKKLVKRLQSKDSEAKRNESISFYVRLNHIPRETWSEGDRLKFGGLCVDLIAAKTGYFYQDLRWDEKNKSVYYLALTDDARAEMKKGNTWLLSQAALYEPMIVPPRPWAPGVVSGAGYLTHYQPPLPLVKSKYKDKRGFLKMLAATSLHYSDAMAPLFAAVNGAQETGWQIRKPILHLIRRLQLTGNDMGVLPELKRKEAIPAPPETARASKILEGWNIEMGDKAAWIATLPAPDQIYVQNFLDWKASEAIRHKEAAKVDSKWLALNRCIITADKLKKKDSIYFPHNLDFRGRMYPVTTGGLCPQGDDYSKALIEFDTAIPLGERGWWWLRIHAANLWGEDKVSLEDRVKWTDDHMEMIRSCAENPYDDRRWADREKVDKPLQFLACCMEINAALKLDNPHEFASRMPIALDGSCSGLQHLGMMSRCVDTGRAVNLIPSDKPSDIYQIVADKVEKDLRKIVAGDMKCKKEEWKEHAQKWLDWDKAWKNGKLNRKITKRSVMTYPYGSAEYGFGEQVMEDTLLPAYHDALSDAKRERVKVEDLFPWPEFTERNHAARLMAWLLFKAVKETVVVPAQIMEWLKTVASKSIFQGSIGWYTPLMFPVSQEYWKEARDKIDGTLYGKRRQPSFRVKTDEPDKTKHKNGIAPNLVHSMDATHMMMTVATARAAGINHFALIHDSFGTHAANTDKLRDITRWQMAKLYETDHVAKLWESLFTDKPVDTAPAAQMDESSTAEYEALIAAGPNAERAAMAEQATLAEQSALAEEAERAGLKVRTSVQLTDAGKRFVEQERSYLTLPSPICLATDAPPYPKPGKMEPFAILESDYAFA